MQTLRNLLVLCLLIAALTCCSGGGTSGTGTINLRGNFSDERGDPVANATIRVDNTGQTTVSDSSGNYSIDLDQELVGDVSLSIRAGDVSSVVVVPDIQDSSSTVTVDLRLNVRQGTIGSTNLVLYGQIVGYCDPFFENLRVIRQSVAAPPGVECTAKVWVSSNGRPVSGVEMAVEYRSCLPGSAWNRIGTGFTTPRGDQGTAQVQFPFFDDQEHCLYRILAPANSTKGTTAVSIEIHSFTYQAQE